MVKMQNMVGEALAEDKKAPLKCWNIMNDHWIYIYIYTYTYNDCFYYCHGLRIVCMLTCMICILTVQHRKCKMLWQLSVERELVRQKILMRWRSIRNIKESCKVAGYRMFMSAVKVRLSSSERPSKAREVDWYRSLMIDEQCHKSWGPELKEFSEPSEFTQLLR